MKKIIIPVILAAVLGVGGGAAAVILNRSNTASAAVTEDSNAALKPGIYYLNGDVNAEMWIEVNPDFLTLKGSDLDNSLAEALRKLYEEDNALLTDEELRAQLEALKQLYCAEKLYQLQPVEIEGCTHAIKVDRDNTITDREELLKTNAGFRFNDKTNTIGLAVGDFILVE